MIAAYFSDSQIMGCVPLKLWDCLVLCCSKCKGNQTLVQIRPGFGHISVTVTEFLFVFPLAFVAPILEVQRDRAASEGV